MANLALKNNTGTSTEITMTNNSGSEWKIINNNGTYTLQGASNVLFTMTDAGLATFYNSIILDGTDTNIRKICSEASTTPIINVASNNFDIDILRISNSTTLTQKGSYGYALRYDGTGTNYNNTLSLMADGSDSTNPRPEEQVIGWSINQYGRMGIRMKPDNNYTLSAFGHVLATRGEGTDAIGVYARNANGQVAIRVNADGLRGLLDVTNNQYMIWYNPEKSRYEATTIYFISAPRIANSTYWPSMYFRSSIAGESDMGRIAYPLSAEPAEDGTQAPYSYNRFYFYQYSYEAGTRTKKTALNSKNETYYPYECFRLPQTEADLTTQTNYEILTTKPSTSTYTMHALRLTNTQDASIKSDYNTALIIGDRAGTHLTMDGNEIIAKTNGTTGGPLYLNSGENGGTIQIGPGGVQSEGNFSTTATAKGYFLTDSAGELYPGIYNNLSHLWIGASQTAARHHVGQTYISAGHNGKAADNGGAGHPSIFISVPNAANNGGTTYQVFHEGFLNVSKATTGTLAITRGGTGATSAHGARSKIVYIGKNPITKLADDTNSNWGALESGVAYFDTANQLNGQPTQYGLLLNMTNGGTVGGQLWITTGGVGYLRASNSNGFSDWYKIWSSKDTLFTAFSSTGGTGSGETLSITVGGVTKTLTLDVAGVNSSGVITNGSQTIAGVKTFNNTIYIRGEDPCIFFQPTFANRQMGAIQNHIIENTEATAITSSYMRILQYSYTKNSHTALQYSEIYSLPLVAENLTENKTYEIFTSKNYSTLDKRYLKLTGGTLSGNILVDKTGSTSSASIAVANDNGKISLYASSNRGLYDHTRDKWIIYTLAADNTTRISDSLYPGSKGALNIGNAENPFKYMYANAFYIIEHTSEKGYGNLRIVTQGTTSTVGVAQLNVGNSTVAGTAGNAYGRIYLGTEGAYGDYLYPSTSAITENKYFYFPDTGGILVTHGTRGTAVGSSSKPVYIASNGRATAITSLNIGSNNITCGTVTCSRIIATSTTDASETKATDTALTLGNTSGLHLIVDGNEIIAKDTATAMGPLYLNGSSIEVNGGVFTAKDGLALNTASYGTDEGEIANPVTGQIYLKYI